VRQTIHSGRENEECHHVWCRVVDLEMSIRAMNVALSAHPSVTVFRLFLVAPEFSGNRPTYSD